MARAQFPDGFFWGAATSSHQVEGGQDNDWTAWEALGKIYDRSVSGLACDHWRRYRDDFDIAESLGHTAHRFSIEWSRIEPRPGEWNNDALQHYVNVVADLKRRKIEPFVTLWHFTSPRWFMQTGGWESKNAPAVFARYVRKVVSVLPDVRYWITLNEANVYTLFGYLVGNWPPEVKNFWRSYRVYRNLADGHAAAFQAVKAVSPQALVGSAHNLVPQEPVRPGFGLDRWAARISDRWYNRRWFNWTAESSDFLGVNHYFRQYVRFGSLRHPIVNVPARQPHSDFGWEMYPAAMYSALREVGEYRRPIFITENGVADAHDQWRQKFIQDELREVYRAINDGVDVRGYFHWSLMDNFEWREGFTKRFGLVAVDFATQQRTVRPSARWFAEVCRTNSIPAAPAAPG